MPTVWDLVSSEAVEKGDGSLEGIPSLNDDDCRQLMKQLNDLHLCQPLNEQHMLSLQHKQDGKKDKKGKGYSDDDGSQGLKGFRFPERGTGPSFDILDFSCLVSPPTSFSPTITGMQGLQRWKASSLSNRILPTTVVVHTSTPISSARQYHQSQEVEHGQTVLLEVGCNQETNSPSAILAESGAQVLRGIELAGQAKSREDRTITFVLSGVDDVLLSPMTASHRHHQEAIVMLLYLIASKMSECNSKLTSKEMIKLLASDGGGPKNPVISLVILVRPSLSLPDALYSYFSKLQVSCCFQLPVFEECDMLLSVLGAATCEDVSIPLTEAQKQGKVVSIGAMTERLTVVVDKVMSLHGELQDDDSSDSDSDEFPSNPVMSPSPLVAIVLDTLGMSDRFDDVAHDIIRLVGERYSLSPVQIFCPFTATGNRDLNTSEGCPIFVIIPRAATVATLARTLGQHLPAVQLVGTMTIGAIGHSSDDSNVDLSEFSIKSDVCRLQDVLQCFSASNIPKEVTAVRYLYPKTPTPSIFPLSFDHLALSSVKDASEELVHLGETLMVLTGLLCPAPDHVLAFDTAAIFLGWSARVEDNRPRFSSRVHRAVEVLELQMCVEGTGLSGASSWRLLPLGRILSKVVGHGLSIATGKAILLARVFGQPLDILKQLALTFQQCEGSSGSINSSSNVFDTMIRIASQSGLLPKKFHRITINEVLATDILTGDQEADTMPTSNMKSATIVDPITRLCAIYASYPFVSTGSANTLLGPVNPPVGRRDIVLVCRRGVRLSMEQFPVRSSECRGWCVNAPVTLSFGKKKSKLVDQTTRMERIGRTPRNPAAEEEDDLSSSHPHSPPRSATILDMGSGALNHEEKAETTSTIHTPRSFLSTTDLCMVLIEPRRVSTTEDPMPSSNSSSKKTPSGGAKQLASGIVWSFPLNITEPLLKFKMALHTFTANLCLFVTYQQLDEVGSMPEAFVHHHLLRALILGVPNTTGCLGTKEQENTAGKRVVGANGFLVDRRFNYLPPAASNAAKALSAVSDTLDQSFLTRLKPTVNLSYALDGHSDTGDEVAKKRRRLETQAIGALPTKEEAGYIKKCVQAVVARGRQIEDTLLKGNTLFGFIATGHPLHEFYAFELQRCGVNT